MGKGKKWKEMSEYDKQTRYKEIGDSLGVRESNHTDIPGGFGGKAYNAYHKKEAYEKRVEDAIGNDYDTRRAIEAAAMSGDGKAKKLAASDFTKGRNMNKAFEFMGTPDDPADYGSKYFREVEAERKAQDEGYAEQFASQDFLEKKLKEYDDKFKSMKNTQEEADIEYNDSEEFAAAKERLESGEYEASTTSMFNPGPSSPTLDFNKQNDQVAARDDQETATGSYLEQYKKDLIKGGRLEEAATDNLNNAYNTVINSNI